MERAGPDAVRLAGSAVPAGRVGGADEVAAAVVWLCTPAAGFITGLTIPVDGGMLAGMPPFHRSRS